MTRNARSWAVLAAGVLLTAAGCHTDLHVSETHFHCNTDGDCIEGWTCPTDGDGPHYCQPLGSADASAGDVADAADAPPLDTGSVDASDTGDVGVDVGLDTSETPDASPDVAVPVDVGTDTGGASGCTAPMSFDKIVVGNQFTCGLRASGALYCWGAIPSAMYFSDTPKLISRGPFTSITAGFDHACVLDATGKAYCWGHNTHGQLGTGDQQASSTPVAVKPPASSSDPLVFAELAAGQEFTCGIDAGTRHAWCWGRNRYGQVGADPTTTAGNGDDSYLPVQVSAPASSSSGRLEFNHIAAGSISACGIDMNSKEAWCWGGNNARQLGTLGTDPKQYQPVQVDGGHSFLELGLGNEHACGRDDSDHVWCWGLTGSGQFPGNSSATPVEIRDSAGGAEVSATALAVGGDSTCAIRKGSGDALCWGLNDVGELGDGTMDKSPYPVTVKDSPQYNFGQLSLSGSTNSSAGDLVHVCALSETGSAAYCWGNPGDGGLGNANHGAGTNPVPVPVGVDCPTP